MKNIHRDRMSNNNLNGRILQFDIAAMIFSFMVVMIHSSYVGFYDVSEGVRIFLSDYYTDYISGFAVPAFFIMSGIKFFKNYEYSLTIKKWESRIASLLIPYLCWNFLSVVWAVIFSYAPGLSNMVAARERFSFSIENIVGGLFWYKFIHPFWYLALLMIFTLLCPLFFSLIRNKYVGIGSIVALYLIDGLTVEFPVTTWPMFQIRTIVYCMAFYLLGAMLGRYKYEWICKKWDKKYRLLAAIMFVAAILLRAFTNNSRMVFVPAILIGIFAIWIIVGTIEIKDCDIIKISFFIYPAHTFVLPCINKLLYLVLPNNSAMCILNTIGGTVITYILCVVLAVFAKRFLPTKVWMTLNGNRA